ncbi:MAG: helix-turn-helix transcriptional regulator [Clostridiales Family XIII bacterium]|nr:helix-turn-helix transcriptional regulator [Clostridia bacterium]MDY3010891.1 helix-turn-helix transcriptional regulator [Clostridiales Family XIII bacterium]
MRINTDMMELKAAERGLSLTELSQEAGISRATISNINRNKSCTGQIFLKIAKALEVEPKELFLKEE